MNHLMRATQLTAFLLVAAITAQAQSTIPGWSEKKDTHPAAVSLLAPEQVTVKASAPDWIELRFHVQDGLHINSHTPSMQELIATALSADDSSDVTLLDTNYPAGKDLMLGSNPPEKLNVYSGDFVLRTRIKTQTGAHLLKLKLRYQACTMTACMPPKTIPVTIGVQGN
jgi:hypothetical protein